MRLESYARLLAHYQPAIAHYIIAIQEETDRATALIQTCAPNTDISPQALANGEQEATETFFAHFAAYVKQLQPGVEEQDVAEHLRVIAMQEEDIDEQQGSSSRQSSYDLSYRLPQLRKGITHNTAHNIRH
jgi:hypothetical protein